MVTKIPNGRSWIPTIVGIAIAAIIFFGIGYLASPPKIITYTSTITKETTAIQTQTIVRTLTATQTLPIATSPASDLRATLRSLLIQHGEGHRLYAYALYFENKDLQQVAVNELLANSKALGDAVAQVYGRDAGNKFTELFNGHIKAVAMYYQSAFSANESGKREAVDLLTKNAMEIATFLSSANPNLPKEAVFSLLRDHALQAMKQADLLAQGKISEESSIYIAMRNHLILIADALADAIVKQFPEKFK
ncbi:MAG: hypothetical protein QXE01_06615 [Sulfolobales archaeon]